MNAVWWKSDYDPREVLTDLLARHPTTLLLSERAWMTRNFERLVALHDMFVRMQAAYYIAIRDGHQRGSPEYFRKMELVLWKPRDPGCRRRLRKAA